MSWLTNVDTSNGPADVEIVPVEVAILTPDDDDFLIFWETDAMSVTREG
jgi:hypothetical protein